jgi:hypothetical protein
MRSSAFCSIAPQHPVSSRLLLHPACGIAAARTTEDKTTAAVDETPISGHPRRYDHGKTIDAKIPAFSFCPAIPGPTVTNSSFRAPLAEVPPPKAIDQVWLKTILFPCRSLIVPTNSPVFGLNPLMVPLVELFETSRVLLSGPKLLGAKAMPQA